MQIKDIHKGGRPKVVRPDGFYMALLNEYQTATIGQLAVARGVSKATICRWLRTARTIAAQQGGAIDEKA